MLLDAMYLNFSAFIAVFGILATKAWRSSMIKLENAISELQIIEVLNASSKACRKKTELCKQSVIPCFSNELNTKDISCSIL